MPDISMCLDHLCPKKEECYRYKAKPNFHWQTYSSFRHIDKDGCKDFVPLKEKKDASK